MHLPPWTAPTFPDTGQKTFFVLTRRSQVPETLETLMAASPLSHTPAVCPRPHLTPKFSPRPLRFPRNPTTSGFRSGAFAIRRDSSLVPRASNGLVIEEEPRVVVGNRSNDKPIVVIDNYDSFTYNLCQYIGELGVNFEVYRNDELTVEEMKRMSPRGILISPGPGTPQDSGISLQTVLELGPSIPLFGVCMGLQCIGEAFGGKVVRSPYGVVHGKGSLVYHDEKGEDGLFFGLPNPFNAGRYHSLVIDRESFPNDNLEITAWTEDGLIMAARHRKYRHILGVQFHPESILTTEGKTMVLNFIKIVERLGAK